MEKCTLLRVCSLQLLFVPFKWPSATFGLWLRVFRMGPFEWLWRSATYLSWQPIVKKTKV
ncbi:DUF418 domain-containing protein [Bacillus subtilis]|uniref:DUF418 domain-containing protein n=1 Tax=Bacillus subtilis TaxID=1423 RepID=UPI003312FE71